jgi:hypothetical protein
LTLGPWGGMLGPHRGVRKGELPVPYAYRNARGQTYFLHAKQVTLQNGRPL